MQYTTTSLWLTRLWLWLIKTHATINTKINKFFWASVIEIVIAASSTTPSVCTGYEGSLSSRTALSKLTPGVLTYRAHVLQQYWRTLLYDSPCGVDPPWEWSHRCDAIVPRIPFLFTITWHIDTFIFYLSYFYLFFLWWSIHSRSYFGAPVTLFEKILNCIALTINKINNKK